MLQFKLTPDAQALSLLDFTPTRATPGSAGYDLKICTAEPITIYPGEYKKLHTGVCIWIGSNNVDSFALRDSSCRDVGIMTPRSSLKGLLLTNSIGIIDEDYQDEFLVSVYNYSDYPIILKPGVSIVQVVFMKAFTYDLIPVLDFSHETTRSGGFGSTGNSL